MEKKKNPKYNKLPDKVDEDLWLQHKEPTRLEDY